MISAMAGGKGKGFPATRSAPLSEEPPPQAANKGAHSRKGKATTALESRSDTDGPSVLVGWPGLKPRPPAHFRPRGAKPEGRAIVTASSHFCDLRPTASEADQRALRVLDSAHLTGEMPPPAGAFKACRARCEARPARSVRPQGTVPAPGSRAARAWSACARPRS